MRELFARDRLQKTLVPVCANASHRTSIPKFESNWLLTMINYYSIPLFFTVALVLLLGAFIYVNNSRSLVNVMFFILCFCSAIWLGLLGIAYNISNSELAIQVIRLSYIGLTFIPISLLGFIIVFLGLNNFYSWLWALGALGIAASIIILHTNWIISGAHHFYWGFYPKAGLYHPLFLGAFVILTIIAGMFLARAYFTKELSLTRRNQVRYVLLALLFLSVTGIDFIPSYGAVFYPAGYALIFIALTIMTFCIVRYRLMDISLLITRTTVFFTVYSLVLGIPFAIALGLQETLLKQYGMMWWVIPMMISTILATLGPFVLMFVERSAEEHIFQDKIRYQTTLRHASGGMSKIKDLRKLLNLIVSIITRTVRIDHSMIFVYDSRLQKFRFGACRARRKRPENKSDLDSQSAIVKMLLRTRSPIVLDEIKQKAHDYKDSQLHEVVEELHNYNAEIAVPSFIEDKLLAFLIMGGKTSGKPYNSDDLSVFAILANQSALAIENAQFYDDMKLTTAQLLKAEKMATVGIMADGLSHQINNRLHALGFIAGDALDTLKLQHNLPMSLEVKEMLLDIEHALNRIESNVQQGGEIVQGLLKYTRKGEDGLAAVHLPQLLAEAIDMTQFKIKPGEVSFVLNLPNDLPAIEGNFAQLQEVFFNLIDNAYDAMIQRKLDLKEPNYIPTVKISALAQSPNTIRILFEDNGIGIKDEDKDKIFTPFFTTKLSSKKGTGLGLYVIQRLIEENHKGKVSYESQFRNGTKVFINLIAIKNAPKVLSG